MLVWILSGLGLIGSFIVVAGYFPQVFKLLKVKNSTGVSIWTWCLFLFGDSLLLIYAISILDPIFIFFEAISCVTILLIIILIYKYRRND